MPIYPWACKKCGAKAEVLRKFDEYATPPTSEEAANEPGQELTEEQKGCTHEFERIITSSPFKINGIPWL